LEWFSPTNNNIQETIKACPLFPMESAPKQSKAKPILTSINDQSPLVGEENQTLECNTTCHAKLDVVCIYEYSMFESVFDNLQPLYLLLTNWDEQFVHNY
jgi:hypothetical protein